MPTPETKEITDVLIIGAGPIGIACALEAEKRGLSYLVIEKGPLVNSLYNYPTNMQFFSSSEKLEIDEIPFISINSKPTKSEALEYYRRIAFSNKLNIHLFEKVEKVEKEKSEYTVVSSQKTYRARNIVVATGFYDLPNLMKVPGENLPKVFHIDIPEDLSDAISKCKSEKDVKQVGIEFMIEQCKELIKVGAPVLHFYTMSNPGPTKQIAEAIF